MHDHWRLLAGLAPDLKLCAGTLIGEMSDLKTFYPQMLYSRPHEKVINETPETTTGVSARSMAFNEIFDNASNIFRGAKNGLMKRIEPDQKINIYYTVRTVTFRVSSSYLVFYKFFQTHFSPTMPLTDTYGMPRCALLITL